MILSFSGSKACQNGPETMKAHIRRMATILLKNERVEIQKLVMPCESVDGYDAVVVFDACQNAWAARVFINKQRRAYRIMKAFRTPLKHSAHAEPTAAKELCHWMKEEFPLVKKIALVTDHMALAKGQKRWWSGNGGFSTAFHINEAFREINGYAEVFHVEGERNICDEDSRSMQAAKARFLQKTEVDELLPDLYGMEHPFLVRRPTKGF